MINEYTYEEVSDSAAQYFSGDALPANVWISKYALKNSDGVLFELNPDDMHKRLSGEISRIEEKYINPLSTELIYSLLKDFKYIIPGGSSMSGIGNNLQIVSLSNCFVVGSQSDSYGGIMYVDQEQVQLMKRRGGVGHDLSHLRPKGSPVKNSALTSTGVVPFMERYSNSTREVAQDGRRGALMLCIDVKHLDSEDFIDAKLEQGKVTGANISVKISDEFMESVTNNANFTQQFPVNSDNPLFTKEVNSLTIWNKIIHNAWKSAEPGVLFWDKTISESIPDLYGKDWKTTATNPCGEIGLCPYDSCRLLSLNLYSYVDYPFTSNAKFNKELFKEHVIYAQRIMDDIIDLEIEKINIILNKIKLDPEADNIKEIEYQLWIKIKNKAELGRRTGLGVTAEGDMLAALGLKYGTPEATDFAEEIQKTLAVNAYKSSIIMAKERGSFSMWNYETEKDAPFIKRIIEQLEPEYVQMFKETGRRNIALLTIAPGGTVSLMTQTTSGIEPVFLPAYKRRRKINPNDKNTTLSFIDEVGDHWEEYNVFHPKFEVWADINNYDVDKLKSMTDDELQEVIKLSPYFGATSNDVDWVEKVNMQGRIQKWIDHSISVTVNLPNNATEELVDKVYKKAWEVGCKGLTIYRDGSRSGVLISNTDKKIKLMKKNFFIMMHQKDLEN